MAGRMDARGMLIHHDSAEVVKQSVSQPLQNLCCCRTSAEQRLRSLCRSAGVGLASEGGVGGGVRGLELMWVLCWGRRGGVGIQFDNQCPLYLLFQIFR